MIKKFKKLLEYNEIDPYGEDNWEYPNNDLWVIYVIGQDENFLAQKQILPNPRFPQWPDYEYKILVLDKNEPTFDRGYSVNSNNAYPVEDMDKILVGKKLVGYIKGFGMTKFDSLQNLCNILNVPIEKINFLHWGR
jgi:hypothetical protein